jgi:hypothetical protein
LSASKTRANSYGYSSMIPGALVRSARFDFERCHGAEDPQNH